MNYNNQSQRPMVSFGEAVSRAFSNYATFQGRARRSEFWWFYLFNVLAGIATTLLDNALGITFAMSIQGPISLIVGLFMVLPLLALIVRRLHDVGKCGWWWFIGLIPIVGPIILLVYIVTDSEPNDNQYGPSPKYVNNAPQTSGYYDPDVTIIKN